MRPSRAAHSVLGNRRIVVIGSLALALVAVAALATGFGIAHSGHSSSGARVTRGGLATCSPSGCSVVSLSRTLPPFTVFYGASCSGAHGTWFFNAVEGGSNDQLRPSYSLKWSFTPGSSTARPSGRIAVQPTDSTQVALTLNQGTLALTGTRKPNVHVAATGTLVVEVSGTAAASILKFTETGLQDAESTLGLVSPFDVAGQPLTVPITTVKTMSGC
jgi:hypothetical protein